MEKNPDIIHFLEEIDIESNIKCIKESIKFFHNEITEYLFDNYSDKLHWYEIYINSGIKYFNYFPTKKDIDLAFFYFCKFDNYYLVDYLLKTKTKFNINYGKPIKNKKYYFFYSYPSFSYQIGEAAKNSWILIFFHYY